MADERGLLQELARRIMATDPAVAHKAQAIRGSGGLTAHVESVRAALGPALEGVGGAQDEQLALETIVVRTGRPVLLVENDDYRLEGPETEIWLDRLGQPGTHTALKRVLPTVGRVEVANHPALTWLGTGWVVDDGLLITNRHVAEEFATRSGDGFIFRRGVSGGRMSADVDFKEALQSADPRRFRVLDIAYIEPDDGPDMALLHVQARSDAGQDLTGMLNLSRRAAAEKDYVATVGYPAADSRVPDQDLVRRLFGDVYNVKRLAPGQLLKPRDGLILHDCSTLGGNSGSPIVRVDTGEVMGLHFSGLFLQENRGVPAPQLADIIARVKRKPVVGVPDRPPAQSQPNGSPPPRPEPSTSVQTPVSVDGLQTIRLALNIPIELSVKIGAIQVLDSQGRPTASDGSVGAPPSGNGAARGTIDEAVAQARARLRSAGNVVTVRDGFVFRNGWITDERAVVVAVKNLEAVGSAIPREVGGFPVEVRAAGPSDYIESMDLAATLEGLPHTTYTPPTDTKLEAVEEKMRIVCHMSPDAGWPILRDFLGETRKRVTAGVYNVTAPHIIDALTEAVEKSPRKLAFVMQKGAAVGKGSKANDRPEDETAEELADKLGKRLDFAWASVGKNHRFASAYHIKVAVRDGTSFWLSSGNWQSSNQPDHDQATPADGWDLLMQHNRDWHVVIDNDKLAGQFEAFLKHDLEQAQEDAAEEALAPPVLEFAIEPAVALERVPPGRPTYFEPLVVERSVKVQPLLTPDNYQEYVLDLINSAKDEILFQNQSFSILGGDKNDARYARLFDALLAKQKARKEVRIIVRGEFDAEKTVEGLKKYGFDTDRIRLQDRCHTKGIIVDRKVVLIGSHNWTNQGTLVNRDASLIFYDADIARYYAQAFEFDWNKLARQSVGRQPRVRVATGDESLDGMMRVAWQELLYS